MLLKRTVYNHQLKCVAFEILVPPQDQSNDDGFIEILEKLIHTADKQLPLFVPYELSSIIESFDPPIQSPIIYKIVAADVGTTYSTEELQNTHFSLALLIDTPQQLCWLNFADYIGLTEQLMNSSDVSKVVKYSKAKQRKVIAYSLAEPINFDKCKAMSMDFYCGDFLYKPVVDDKIEIAGSKLNLLHLIQSLQKEDCNLQVVSKIIQSDPIISFQLLKLANSAGFSGGNPIQSIEQATARLGLIHLKNWVLVLSMKNISDKPVEVLESGLIRAHMAEQLAKASTTICVQSAYTAGLLSILDCLLNKPMSELLTQITLSDEVSEALANKTGALGALLSTIVAYESGDWDSITESNVYGLDLSKLYIDSLELITNNSAPGFK
jgi:c-di-GMP-related signal transduction protein